MKITGYNNITSILTLFVVFILFFSYGEAVICYECNSRFDPRCGDPFDPYGLGMVNCSLQPRPEHLSHVEPTICRKIAQKVYGKLRVVRSCGYVTDERDSNGCVRRVGTHDVMAFYCGCTTDLCNAAKQNSPITRIFGIFGLILTWIIN